jgi:hypothetical protein
MSRTCSTRHPRRRRPRSAPSSTGPGQPGSGGWFQLTSDGCARCSSCRSALPISARVWARSVLVFTSDGCAWLLHSSPLPRWLARRRAFRDPYIARYACSIYPRRARAAMLTNGGCAWRTSFWFRRSVVAVNSMPMLVSHLSPSSPGRPHGRDSGAPTGYSHVSRPAGHIEYER